MERSSNLPGGPGTESERAIPIAREGYVFILLAFVPAAAAAYFRLWWLFAFFSLLCAFVTWFFRDPQRETPAGEGLIVSPADGRVIKAGRTMDDRFLHSEVMKISIFMNLFNVHVNRIPASGRVERVIYNPGKFFSADLDKASLENEQNALVIEAEGGRRFVTNQIAGLVARRIVCRVGEGDEVRRGARFGLIRFGSRLDVYLPPETRVDVRVGEKVRAGSTVLGRW